MKTTAQILCEADQQPKWTAELPKEPGEYWWTDGKLPVELFKVESISGVHRLVRGRGKNGDSEYKCTGYWCPAIPPEFPAGLQIRQYPEGF